MKHFVIPTLTGTIFSIAAIPYISLFWTFVSGAVGALGALLLTLLFKWIERKLTKKPNA